MFGRTDGQNDRGNYCSIYFLRNDRIPPKFTYNKYFFILCLVNETFVVFSNVTENSIAQVFVNYSQFSMERYFLYNARSYYEVYPSYLCSSLSFQFRKLKYRCFSFEISKRCFLLKIWIESCPICNVFQNRLFFSLLEFFWPFSVITWGVLVSY